MISFQTAGSGIQVPRGSLLRRQSRQFIGGRYAARIDLADAQPFTLGRHANRGRAIAKRHLDQPYPPSRCGIAPQKCGRRDLRWENGALLGVVERQRARLGAGTRSAGETNAEEDGYHCFHRRHVDRPYDFTFLHAPVSLRELLRK
ncbi:MAG: hypothetical protein WDO73_01630 [Ignavibacteriota bacterium]